MILSILSDFEVAMVAAAVRGGEGIEVPGRAGRFRAEGRRDEGEFRGEGGDDDAVGMEVGGIACTSCSPIGWWGFRRGQTELEWVGQH